MVYDNRLASTPTPPYYAVIFTSVRTEGDHEAYEITAQRMGELAAKQDGYLGIESVRDSIGVGITVSYWRDLESIHRWHAEAEHQAAQASGRSKWYQSFAVRICRVERNYNFDSPQEP